MKTPEELNALKEEALEKVVGGVITTEGDQPNPGNPNPGPDPHLEFDPTACPNYRLDSLNRPKCGAPITGRTKTACASCPAEGLFK